MTKQRPSARQQRFYAQRRWRVFIGGVCLTWARLLVRAGHAARGREEEEGTAYVVAG